MTVTDPFEAYCLMREAKGLRRSLTVTTPLPDGRALRGGQTVLHFGGNDYLGLLHDPALARGTHEAVRRFGVGSGASRLVSGNNPLAAAIETKLARGKGTEAALLLSSGYQANVTVLAALADPALGPGDPVILADRLCHQSLLQGAVLSGARLQRFRHNDMGHLETLLLETQTRGSRTIIVSESVFSMDGDRADLVRLSSLARRYGALLYVDEAHATGVFGRAGFGLTADQPGSVDVVMGTFGKALGSFGAYVACRASIRDYLIQSCGGLIYSTALPPPVLGAIDAALDLLPELEARRSHLLGEAHYLREALRAQGWAVAASTTQIIPVLLGHEAAALQVAAQLLEAGIFVPAIRPPTVPRGTSRLRISLSAAHSRATIERLIEVLAGLRTRSALPSVALAS